MRRIFIAILLFCFIAGCSQSVEEKGIVAKVNGEPIYLKEMEARYDLNNLGWVSGVVPSVEAMSAEYGNVLSELIIYKLIGFALKEEGMEVSNADVAAEEQSIRADYPDDLFERTLTEEYIDIAVWRVFLKRHMELKLFLNDVLRSKISLNYQEVEAYYKDHLSEFYIPERLHVLRVTGVEKNSVLRVTDALENAENWKEVVAKLDGSVTVREMKLKKDRLPQLWAPVLQKLTPGTSSTVSVTSYGFEQLVLLNVLPEKLLGPSQAYSVIERILIDQKLQGAFMDWLAAEVAKAKIEVTPLLAENLSQREEYEEPAADAEVLKKEEPYREPESEVGKSSDP